MTRGTLVTDIGRSNIYIQEGILQKYRGSGEDHEKYIELLHSKEPLLDSEIADLKARNTRVLVQENGQFYKYKWTS